MRCQNRFDSRLWVLVVACLFIVSLPAFAGSPVGPTGNSPAGSGGVPGYLDSPNGGHGGGGENNSGDPDDWGIDFHPYTPGGSKCQGEAQTDQAAKSTAGNNAVPDSLYRIWGMFLTRLWFLAQ
jgi:hypothetical protein